MMALIKCLECGKDVSNKAASCPNCGNPIQDMQKEDKINVEFPSLPKDLSIGKTFYTVGDSGGMPGFKGLLIEEELNKTTSRNKHIPSEELKFVLHTHGIELTFGLMDESFEIHNSQIIELIHTSKTELLKDSKSVIGRSVAGGLLLGPLGAVVGGMSGIGNKEKQGSVHYLIINYWDIDTKNPETLIILSEKSHIKTFIALHEKESMLNESKGRKAEEDTFGISGWIGVLSIIAFIVMIILGTFR